MKNLYRIAVQGGVQYREFATDDEARQWQEQSPNSTVRCGVLQRYMGRKELHVDESEDGMRRAKVITGEEIWSNV